MGSQSPSPWLQSPWDCAGSWPVQRNALCILSHELPEDAALQGWVRQYKAQAQDTQEFPRPIEKPTPQKRSSNRGDFAESTQGAPGPVTNCFVILHGPRNWAIPKILQELH